MSITHKGKEPADSSGLITGEEGNITKRAVTGEEALQNLESEVDSTDY